MKAPDVSYFHTIRFLPLPRYWKLDNTNVTLQRCVLDFRDGDCKLQARGLLEKER